MKKNTLFMIASVLILVALVLIVWGFNNETALLWQAGLGVITLAMLLSLGSRWIEAGAKSEKDNKK